MKAEKRLKNLIDESGKELLEKNEDFRAKMLATYYPEQKVEKVVVQKTAKPFYRRWSFGALACCLAIVLSVGVVVSATKLNAKNGLGGDVISLPSYADRVAEVDTQDVNLNDYQLAEKQATLPFATIELSIPADIDIYEDFTSDGTRNFYYMTGVSGEGFFRLQLVTNPNYAYTSRLTDKTNTINCKGVDIVYSVIYAESTKSVYIFSEAKLDGQTLAVDYTVSSSDFEQQFISFMNSIIL